jgi:hypothetical protein
MMPEQHLYEYAVIRVLPRVEREEFVNVGMILFCKRQKYIRALVKVDEKKILALDAGTDLVSLQSNLSAFIRIAEGDKSAGPIALLDLTERFRWLTAVRSSCIQTSRPHPGLSKDLEKTAQRLMGELVM